MQVLALACIKLSLIFYYRSIFNTGQGKTVFSVVSIFLILFTIIWAISFFFAFLFNCGAHPEANWTTYQMNLQYCWPESSFLLVYSWSDFIMDLAVFLLPIAPVRVDRFFVTARSTNFSRFFDFRCPFIVSWLS